MIVRWRELKGVLRVTNDPELHVMITLSVVMIVRWRELKGVCYV